MNSIPEVLVVLMVAASVLSGFYIIFSRNFLRANICFFILLLGVSTVFLELGSEYLAIFLLILGLLFVAIHFVISGGIFGDLKKIPFQSKYFSKNYISHWFSCIFGISVAFLHWYSMMGLDSSGGDRQAIEGTDLLLLGDLMLSKQTIIFELFGIFVLISIIGSSLLLRKR